MRSRSSIALLAIAASLCALSANAQAAFPGANGKIAYTNGSEINVVNSDGTGQQTLGNAPFTEVLGYSPDGTKLAFSVDGAIYMANSDGSGATSLNLFPGLPTGGVTWSPDGQTVMAGGETFSSEEGYADRIRKSRVDGSSDGVLVSDEANAPSWSPGGRVVFAHVPGGAVQYDGRNELWTMNPDGSGQTPLGTTGGAPDWSPDGHRIAFSAYGGDGLGSTSQIWVINADGTGKIQLTSPPATSDRYPAWSPDGRQIAFIRNDHVWVMNADGTAQTDITPADTGSNRDPTWQPIPYTGYARPRGASPFQTYLVPAYKPCTAPNETHGAPLAFDSCSPPEPTSDYLTIGTPDSNGQGARSRGVVKLAARLDNPSIPGDQADLAINVSISDVRNKADLSDYTGSLQATFAWRMTDSYNQPTLTDPATVADVPNFPVNVACAATADATVGSTCALTTSGNAVVVGGFRGHKRTVLQVDHIDVLDGGDDGDPNTDPPSTLFLTQGLFIP